MLGKQVEGHRYYLSLSRNIKDVGITYEYKDYDMPYDMITFSAPPTVSIESTSILAARNSHSINYGDEEQHNDPAPSMESKAVTKIAEQMSCTASFWYPDLLDLELELPDLELDSFRFRSSRFRVRSFRFRSS